MTMYNRVLAGGDGDGGVCVVCMGGDGDGNGRLLAVAGSAQVAAPAGALLQVQDADGRRHRAEGESQLRRARPGLQVFPEIRGSNKIRKPQLPEYK